MSQQDEDQAPVLSLNDDNEDDYISPFKNQTTDYSSNKLSD